MNVEPSSKVFLELNSSVLITFVLPVQFTVIRTAVSYARLRYYNSTFFQLFRTFLFAHCSGLKSVKHFVAWKRKHSYHSLIEHFIR